MSDEIKTVTPETILICKECGEEVIYSGDFNQCTGCRTIEGETTEITIDEYEQR